MINYLPSLLLTCQMALTRRGINNLKIENAVSKIQLIPMNFLHLGRCSEGAEGVGQSAVRSTLPVISIRK